MDFSLPVFVQALTSTLMVRGALITISLSVLSLIAAITIGLVVALGRRATSRAPRLLSAGYVWLFRALPTLLWLLIFWYAIPQLVPTLKENWYTPFVAGLIALSLGEAAYLAEIIRSAMLSVDPGQRLAAKALGMSAGQSLRHVVSPQVIRIAIPPTANEFVTIVKLTSLGSVISLKELLTITQQQISATFRFAEWYSAVAVYYLAIVTVMMIMQSRLERRYRWSSSHPRTGSKWRLYRRRSTQDAKASDRE